MASGRLRIALLSAHTGIEEVLSQIGITCFIADQAEALTPRDASVLVVGRRESSHMLQRARAFADAGGAILDFGAAAQLFFDTKPRAKFRTFLAPDEKILGMAVGAFDVDAEVDHVGGDWLQFAHAGSGPYCFLGLHIKKMYTDLRSCSRRFASAGPHIPAEEVSRSSTGAIPFLLVAILRRLCHERGLPFAHRWYHPGPHRSVVLFRIDTDFAQRDAIMQYHDLIRKHDITCTWFLHTAAHKGWLDLFTSFSDDETALHCGRHFTASDTSAMNADISHALASMRHAGIRPRGYAAPYGVYQSGITDILKENGIVYRSDFGRAHEGLPLCTDELMQLPIHPVSIGSLVAAHASNDEIDKYFEATTRRLSGSFLPVALYDHPGHRNMNNAENMLSILGSIDGRHLTFGEWHDFWKARSALPADPVVGPDGQIVDQNSSDDFPLAVYPSDSAKIILQKQSGTLATFDICPCGALSYSDFRSLRRFDLQTAKRHLLAKNLWRRTGPEKEENMS